METAEAGAYGFSCIRENCIFTPGARAYLSKSPSNSDVGQGRRSANRGGSRKVPTPPPPPPPVCARCPDRVSAWGLFIIMYIKPRLYEHDEKIQFFLFIASGLSIG
jgi:hypothetical protein